MPPEPTNTTSDIDAARERARLAMQGEARATKAIEEDKQLTEKRRTAALAMEGVDRRAKREQKEKELKEKQEMLRRIDEEVKRREEDAARKKQEAEDAKKNLAANQEAELKQKETDFTESQSTIEKLKEERGSTLKTIHTLQSDIAEAIKTENLSTEKISIAESERRPATTSISKEETGGGIGKYLISVLIIIILAGLGFGTYWYWQNRTVAPVASVAVKAIIFAQTSYEINTGNISSTALPTQMQALLAAPAGTGEKIVNVYFTKQASSSDGQIGTKSLLNFNEWLAYSNSAFPADFPRFVQDYMIGLDKNGSSSSFFIVLKTDSYANVYQNLLDHEGDWVRNIFQSLDGTDIAGATTDQKFVDYVLKNLATRVLRDKDSQTVLIYTFLDQQTFIAARNEDALYNAYTVYNTKAVAN